jgi:hypothetical protein
MEQVNITVLLHGAHRGSNAQAAAVRPQPYAGVTSVAAIIGKAPCVNSGGALSRLSKF